MPTSLCQGWTTEVAAAWRQSRRVVLALLGQLIASPSLLLAVRLSLPSVHLRQILVDAPARAMPLSLDSSVRAAGPPQSTQAPAATFWLSCVAALFRIEQ